MSELSKHVAYHVECGCRYSNGSLGIQDMPPGYALMLDADELYYYWLRADGATSDIHWSQWAVRKGAIADARRQALDELAAETERLGLYADGASAQPQAEEKS